MIAESFETEFGSTAVAKCGLTALNKVLVNNNIIEEGELTKQIEGDMSIALQQTFRRRNSDES